MIYLEFMSFRVAPGTQGKKWGNRFDLTIENAWIIVILIIEPLNKLFKIYQKLLEAK